MFPHADGKARAAAAAAAVGDGNGSRTTWPLYRAARFVLRASVLALLCSVVAAADEPQPSNLDHCKLQLMSQSYAPECGRQIPAAQYKRFPSMDAFIESNYREPGRAESWVPLIVNETQVFTAPLFVIIGAQKAGTTSLRGDLLQHHQMAGKRIG